MTDRPTNGDQRPRTKTRGVERADAIQPPTREELAERILQLEREVEQVRRTDEEHRNNWHRSAADFANYKRRTDDERVPVDALHFGTRVLDRALLAL